MTDHRAQLDVAWVIVDLQQAFSCPETSALARAVRSAVALEPGPAYALVQENPSSGPMRVLRNGSGAAKPGDEQLLEPLAELEPTVFAKVGYGALTPLPTD